MIEQLLEKIASSGTNSFAVKMAKDIMNAVNEKLAAAPLKETITSGLMNNPIFRNRLQKVIAPEAVKKTEAIQKAVRKAGPAKKTL